MSNEAAFATWWAREMKDMGACPPVPRQLSELTLTAQMAMKATHPQLYTALFAGKHKVCLPADVSVRLQSGQLQPGDAGALLSAGFEEQAQHCERLGDAAQDQRMADQIAHSREVYAQERQRFARYSEMGLLERLGHAPALTPDQIAANRRRYGGAVQE